MTEPIHVEHVHVTTDRPLPERDARALSTALVNEMRVALRAGSRPAPALRIGELRLNLPAAALSDRALLTDCAREAVRRILDRMPE